MIRITKQEIGAERFAAYQALLKCLAKDKIKEVFSRILVDGDNVVATDSRRLAVLTNAEKFEDGQYEVVTKSAKEIILERAPKEKECSYPQWKQYVPDEKKAVKSCLVKPNGITGNAKAIFSIARILPEENTLNINFVNDALIDDADVYAFEKDGPVLFVMKDLKVVIMTIRNQIAGGR